MLIQQNFLRIVRKRTYLTQVDIAALLRISDRGAISRWEQGQRTPNVEVLLLYHLLFDTSTESLFNRQKQQLKPVVIARIRERIEYLNGVEKDEKIEGRIAYLQGALNRLTS